jgi:uncharacterized membrane protein SpoIIM required for sporulation
MSESMAQRIAAGPAASGTTELVLKSSEFRRGREQSWRELDMLVAMIEKRGITVLAPEQLQRLPVLYRSALSSLSVARSIALDRNLLIYLENLALRAFLVVYGPRTGLLQGLADFLRDGFPKAVRGAGWHCLIALVALLTGFLAGFALTVVDESWFSAIVPAGLAGGRGPASTRAELLDQEIFAPWQGAAMSFGLVANFLFSHNTTIGILTFGLGLVAGVPTLLLLAYQGLILGTFVALHYNRGLTVDFLGWVAIHGVTEISAILLCGAAGLVVAETILFPGRYSRLESLALRGRAAAAIAIGAVLMFFVAAILEGGFRQLVQSTPLRFEIATATAIAWLFYFLRGGRTQPP